MQLKKAQSKTVTSLEIQMLGVAAVRLDGVEYHLPTRKALALLTYLALEGTTKRNKLADLFWGELDEDDARKNLRQELHRLSKTPLATYLELRPETIGLTGIFDSDVSRFRRFVAEGNLEQALGWYKGALLEGFSLRGATGFDEWLPLAREALASEYCLTLERAAQAREALGNTREALEAYITLLAADELQERYHREAMRLHIGLGEREAALKQFERCQQMLRHEFALEPLPETLALAEQARARTAMIVRNKPDVVKAPGLEPALIGREAAWERLEQAWRKHRTVLIAGEAGVGKSRLLREFAASKGRYIPNNGLVHDANVPFSTQSRAIRQVFNLEPDLVMPTWVRRELSRLVPELSDQTMPAMQSEGDRLRLFDAYTEYLIALYNRFELLVSDDLHYFDASSLEMGNYAAVQLLERGFPALAVATLRFDGLTPPLEAQIRALTKAGAVELIELEPLDEAAIVDMIGQLSGPAVLFPRRLHASTGGNPFFVLETLRALFESGELLINEDGLFQTPYDDVTEDYRELPIPTSVRETVLARSARLSSATRRLLEVGSLAPEPFRLGTVAKASALAEWEALEALEQAISAQLLRETPDGYLFSHDLIRRIHAANLGAERRRLIHYRLAHELEVVGAPSAQIALHLEQADRSHEAALHWAKAAQMDLVVYNMRDALTRLTRALEIAPDGAPERFAWLLEHENIARELGERDLQHADLDSLESLAINPQQQASVALRRSNLLALIGKPHQALEKAEYACGLLEPFGGKEYVEALVRLVQVTYYVENFSLALERANRAVALARDISPQQLASAANWQSVLYATLGDPEAALRLNDAALEAWRFAPDRLLKARLHNNRATLLNLYGSFAPALEHADIALEIVTSNGFVQLEGFVRDTRARSLRGLARFEEAAQELKTAIELGQRTGNHRLVSTCLRHRVQLLTELGDAQAVLEAADEAFERATATSSISNQILILTARAQAWLQLDQNHAALNDTTAAIRLLESGSGMREAFTEGVRWVHAQALSANERHREAKIELEKARAEAQARLEQLHDPQWREAFLNMPINQALFAKNQN